MRLHHQAHQERNGKRTSFLQIYAISADSQDGCEILMSRWLFAELLAAKCFRFCVPQTRSRTRTK